MKLSGYRRINSNGYYISVFISIPSYSLFKPITFLVDTGCELTTINHSDARDFGIDEIAGNLLKGTGLGGTVNAVPLYGCSFCFVTDNFEIQWEPLNKVLVSKPVVTWENYDTVMSVPSLLGMDVLQNYTISFPNNRVILEK
jgi:hypothetical protein